MTHNDVQSTLPRLETTRMDVYERVLMIHTLTGTEGSSGTNGRVRTEGGVGEPASYLLDDRQKMPSDQSVCL